MDVRSAQRARVAALLILLAVAAIGAQPAVARTRDADDATIRADRLPAEARETLARIERGDRLPYERDGVVFGNRERLLPAQPRGYYHEYTVKTPGARTRGARRIVCGGAVRAATECYYSSDHYRSFRRILQ